MGFRSLTGRSFVVAKYLVEAESGRLPKSWTVRLLFLGNENSEPIVYWPLYKYMVAHWSRSDTWQSLVARSLGLFWDYCEARSPTLSKKWTKWQRERELLRGFAGALLNGTVADGKDPLELFWSQQSLEFAKRTVSAVEQFAVWAAIELNLDRARRMPNSTVPHGSKSFVDAVLSNKRRGFSLLGYLTPVRPARTSAVDFPRTGTGFNRETDYAISFPPAYTEATLWDGFTRPGKQGATFLDHNVRDMMIFLLQGYGGLREHEPFHLWIEDVVEDPYRKGHASVALFHPENGLAFIDDENGGQRRTTRRERLWEDYRLVPRTRGIGSYKVGWKNSKVISKDQYAFIYWTDPVASALFWQLYLHYLATRTYLMARRRSLLLPSHPFLFVSERENRGAAFGSVSLGAPASIESYEASLKRAVNLVGLRSAKSLGTTSQGLRHLYAYTLRALGVSSKVLQEGLRHRHPYSQDIYGKPTPSDINTQIQTAIASNRGALPSGLALDRSFRWIEERYPQYRTGPGGLL